MTETALILIVFTACVVALRWLDRPRCRGCAPPEAKRPETNE